MSTRIGIISDPHAAPAALEAALAIFEQHEVDTIICAGDIAGYFDALAAVINLLQDYRVSCIIGNHDRAFLDESNITDTNEYQFLAQLPGTLQLTIEDKRIYVVHAEPPAALHGGIKLLDLAGEVNSTRKLHWQQRLENFDTDVLIVGHTHQVITEQFGNLLLINPGSTVFNHSAMILTLPEMSVETFALEDKAIVKCWNWGLFVQNR